MAHESELRGVQAVIDARRTGEVFAYFKDFDSVAEGLQAGIFLVIFVLWMIIVNYPIREQLVVTSAPSILPSPALLPPSLFASLSHFVHLRPSSLRFVRLPLLAARRVITVPRGGMLAEGAAEETEERGCSGRGAGC